MLKIQELIASGSRVLSAADTPASKVAGRERRRPSGSKSLETDSSEHLGNA